MTSDTYKIINDFQANNMRVLELDRNFTSFASGLNAAEINGVRYEFTLNSIRSWMCIESNYTFKGKTVRIVHVD